MLTASANYQFCVYDQMWQSELNREPLLAAGSAKIGDRCVGLNRLTSQECDGSLEINYMPICMW